MYSMSDIGISSDTDSSGDASRIGPLQVLANEASSSSASSSASAARLGAVLPKSRSSLVGVPPANNISAMVSAMASNIVPAASSSSFLPVDSSSFLPAVSANSMGPSPTNSDTSSGLRLSPINSSFDDVEVVGEKIPEVISPIATTATLVNVDIGLTNTNSLKHFSKKKILSGLTDKEQTRIVSILKVPIVNIKLDDLRTFASQVQIAGTGGKTKKTVCDMIIKRVTQDQTKI